MLCGGELADYDFGEQKVSSDCCYHFLELHFHPDLTDCPEPSLYDLAGTKHQNEFEGMDIRPINVVAHILWRLAKIYEP